MKRIFKLISVIYIALFFVFDDTSINAITSQNSENNYEIIEENKDNIISQSQEEFVTSLEEVTEKEIDKEYMQEKNLEFAIGKTANGNVIYSNMTKEDIIESNRGMKNAGYTVGSNTWKKGASSTYIARLEMAGVGAIYCIDPGASFPTGQNYDGGSIYADPGVKAILWYGFPSNIGGDRPSEWDDNDAYNSTYLALNAYLYPNGFAMVPGGYVMTRTWLTSKGDVYLNTLVQRGLNGTVPDVGVTITEPTNTQAFYVEELRMNVTDWFLIMGGNHVAINNLPTGVYVQAEDRSLHGNGGVIRSNQYFRIVTKNLNFTGNVTPSFTSDIRLKAAVIFRSSGVQSVVTTGYGDPIVPISKTAKFIDTTSEGKLIKLDEDTQEKITSGAVFEMYSYDSVNDVYIPYINESITQVPDLDNDGNEIWDLKVNADTNKIFIPNLLEPEKSYELDMKPNYFITSNGEINLTDIPTMDLYFGEVVEPEGYVGEEDVYHKLEVTEGGQLYELEITNRIAKAIVEFEKIDKVSRLMIPGAKIRVEKYNYNLKAWEDIYEFTSKAGETHKKEFVYGHYRVSELIFPNGYVAKLEPKYFKITKDDDNKVISVIIENIKELPNTGNYQTSGIFIGIALLVLLIKKLMNRRCQ